MITLEAVEIVMGWDSPLRVKRFNPNASWGFSIKYGIRKASTSYKDRAVCGWWFNPWIVFTILGLYIGAGFAMSQPTPKLIKDIKDVEENDLL